MIYLITGENQFRVDEALADKTSKADEVERLDGAALTREALSTALFSVSLFAKRRVVIIDELSKHKSLWEALPEIISDAPSVDVIFHEPRPDKRLKTYKWLTKAATVIDCSHLLASDAHAAEKWLVGYAKEQGVELASAQAGDMVARAQRADASSSKPIIDQQLLATAISQLRSADVVTDEMIDAVLAPSVYENVFTLLGAALDGRGDGVARQIAHMRQTEEPHMVLGLLASQLTQLAALFLAGPDESIEAIAKASGAHPYALRSMQKYSSRLTADTLSRYVDLIIAADAQIKTSSIDPWTALDVALMKIALENHR